jgi:DNA repair protein RadC
MQAKPQNSAYYRIRDLPPRQRPREQMELRGADKVSDVVLLSIILAKGIQGLNVIDLAEELLNRYRTLSALAGASVDELKAIRGMGPVKAQILVASLELAKRLSEERTTERQIIRTPADAASLLAEQARSLQQEMFWMLPLDARNHLQKKAPVEISKGLLDASLVHPREVFKPAIACSSAAIVLVHNHPSGDPTPSAEDIRITRQLVEAGKVLDVRVLDHVILGKASSGENTGFLSLRESGLVQFVD